MLKSPSIKVPFYYNERILLKMVLFFPGTNEFISNAYLHTDKTTTKQLK